MPARKSKTQTKSKPVAAKADPRFPARPRSQRIGGNIVPTKDMSRFVRWPRYVRIQRQKKILLQRLKVPPSLNQFKRTLERPQAANLFKLLQKYQPETSAEKKARLAAQAEAKVAGGSGTSAPGAVLKFGLNHVTHLIESKKAKLVVIAHDVDPIELVVWLPALCRKMGVPYCIVKGKGRVGTLVHQKKATAVALTDVNPEDKAAFAKITEMCETMYNKSTDPMRRWGGGIMGLKTQRKLEKRQKALEAELAKKALIA